MTAVSTHALSLSLSALNNGIYGLRRDQKSCVPVCALLPGNVPAGIASIAELLREIRGPERWRGLVNGARGGFELISWR